MNSEQTVDHFTKLTPGQGGVSSDAEFSGLGGAMANLGDLDSNGTIDLFVAAPSDEADGLGTGAVWVFFLDRDQDRDVITDENDEDNDNDGIPDEQESTGDADLDQLDNQDDLDSDQDGIPDAVEANKGVLPANMEPDGKYPPAYAIENDTDGDGLMNDVDPDDGGTPLAWPNSDFDDAFGKEDTLDADSDDDGIVDAVEANSGVLPANMNDDGQFIFAYYVSNDEDSDGIVDDVDPDFGGVALLVPDTDGDGVPDYSDIDADGDGIVDNIEAQDTDSYIAPTEPDDDEEGVSNVYDPDNGGTALKPIDTDEDGIPDYIDVDSDGDSVLDSTEGHDANSDGIADIVPIGTDTDGDGLDDAYDTIEHPNIGNEVGAAAALQDFDGDGILDWRDSDDDNDGEPNEGSIDPDGDGIPKYLDPIFNPTGGDSNQTSFGGGGSGGPPGGTSSSTSTTQDDDEEEDFFDAAEEDEETISFIDIAEEIADIIFGGDDTQVDDVSGHWAEDYIEALLDLGVISDKSEGQFIPNEILTRGEWVKIVADLFEYDAPVRVFNPSFPAFFELEEPTVDGTSYSDLGEDDWYTLYIELLTEAGILEGYRNGQFKPGDPITRIHALKIILEASGLTLEEGTETFDDVFPSAWYYKYITFALENNIIDESSDGKFHPDDPLTRAEGAKIAILVYELTQK